MSKWIVDIHGDIEGDYDIIGKYEEPKTGHWINRHIIANKSIDMIVCSECGEEFSYDAETGISEYNYCPNCGAEMR